MEISSKGIIHSIIHCICNARPSMGIPLSRMINSLEVSFLYPVMYTTQDTPRKPSKHQGHTPHPNPPSPSQKPQ